MNQRIRHQVAFAATLQILEGFSLRDEEKNEAFGYVFERVKEALASYDKESQDLLRRLKPLEN